MFKTTRGIAVLALAFALTLVALHFLNRKPPAIAFEKITTLPYGQYKAFDFGTTGRTKLALQVRSDPSVAFDALLLTKEEYGYFEQVITGKVQRTRPVAFLWESLGETSHRSPPIPVENGDYVLYVENARRENTQHSPLTITLRAEDLLADE